MKGGQLTMLRKAVLVSGLLLCAPRPDAMAGVDHSSDGVLHRMFDTAVDVIGAPADLTPRQQWEAVAVAGAALALMSTSADESLSRSISKPVSRFGESISDFGRHLGEVPLNFGALALFGTYGWLADDADAQLTFESGILAGGLSAGAVQVIKYAVGRARPNRGLGSGHFRPFGGDQSFPSGHTAFSFSLAGTINYFYPGAPGVLAFALASTTAYSRVHTLAHFPSDVLVAAALGTWISRAVAQRWDHTRRPDIEIVPTVSEDGGGATVMRRF